MKPKNHLAWSVLEYVFTLPHSFHRQFWGWCKGLGGDKADPAPGAHGSLREVGTTLEEAQRRGELREEEERLHRW